MLPENLGHLFDVPLQLQSTAPALLQDDVVLTFGDLEERCNRMANALVSLGVQPGNRIALMFTNDYRFIESLLGTMRVGAVPVPLNIRMGDEAILYVMADSEAVVLLANSEMADRARRLLPQIPGVRHFMRSPPPHGYLRTLPAAGTLSTSARSTRGTKPKMSCWRRSALA
jgi:acyl-CoA synthetase (AMP-forming)/AMP-acid ligase II